MHMVQLEKKVPNMLTVVYKGLCNMAWLLGISHPSSNSALIMHITYRDKGIYRHQQLESTTTLGLHSSAAAALGATF